VKAHGRQSGTFRLRLLFVCAERLGAVVVDLGFFVRAESCGFFLNDLWYLNKFGRALNGWAGLEYCLKCGISQGCKPLGFLLKSVYFASLFHTTSISRPH